MLMTFCDDSSRDGDEHVFCKTGVIEVEFHEDSDGFMSLVGRPLTRPRTNSLELTPKKRDDISACITPAAATLSELATKENRADHSSDEHICHDAAAKRGHR